MWYILSQVGVVIKIKLIHFYKLVVSVCICGSHTDFSIKFIVLDKVLIHLKNTFISESPFTSLVIVPLNILKSCTSTSCSIISALLVLWEISDSTDSCM